MKRFYFLLISFLTLSFIVIAQVKMFVHQSNGNIVEILASRVDSISLSFPSKEEPDDPDVPVEPVFYTISFDANGGTGTFSSEELEENKTYVIPSNVFIREGYKFIGWNTKSNGTGISYTEGQNIIINNDLTLYAQWEEVLKLETIVLSAEQIDDTNQVRVVAECSITPQRIVWLSKTENGTYREIQGENNNVLIITPEPSAYTYVKANMVTKSDEVVESLPIIISSTCLSVVFNDDFGTFERETDRASTPYVGPEYIYVGGCKALKEEGTYAVMVNPKFAGSSDMNGESYACDIYGDLWYRDIYDHTQGGKKNDRWGGLLLVNADAELVYSREVDVTPNTLMKYSAWVAYAANHNDDYGEILNSEITFVVRDARGRELVEMSLRLEESGEGWQKGEVVFNTEENSIVTIELYNNNRGGVGNDFVIDDISFTICDEQNIGIIKPTSISFNANGGVGSNTSDVINPLVYYLIPSNSFTREGYCFTGWNTKADGTGETLVVGQSMFIKEDLTLYAQWVKGVTVSFNANGGVGNNTSDVINPLVHYLIPSNSFTREGYFFTGWNTKADGTGETLVVGQSMFIKENLTLYAQWVKGVTVLFNANGGNGAMNSMLINPTKSFTIPTNTFTNEDNFCKGWNTKADGTGIAYAGAQTISITESVTLYAQWEKLITTGIENGHGYVDLGLPSGLRWATMNVGAESPEDYGDYFAWGETESKSTYNWKTYKWCEGSYDTQTKYCTSSSYGTVDNKTTLDLSDDAAYVNWGGDWRMPTKAEQDELRSECTWTWGTLNGVQGYKVTSKSNGNSIFLPAAGYRYYSDLDRAGYYGYYWSSSLYMYSGYAYYLGLFSNSVSSSYYRDYGCSVRPVSYIKLSFSLMFSGNGVEGTMPTIKAKEDEQISIPSSTYTRLGYEFIGWNTKADGSGASYAAGENLTLTTDLTLYAQWKEIIKYYTLSFNANGGNGSMNSIELEEGKNFTIPSNPFTRTDYEFIGWNTKADGSGASYTAGESLTLTTDLTLYAQWKKIIKYYTLSFNANGGNGSMNSIELEEGKNFTIPSNPFTRTDYEFIGWNTKADGTGTSYTEGQTISLTENTTLYAQWDKFYITGTANGHDYVDLGLPSGTKWATCNVGADSPEDYGDYFAWGETEPKDYYESSNYNYSSTPTTLPLDTDAAYTNWGSSWRMPTYAEQDELRNTNYTTWTWTTQNGVNGYKVTSKVNGNSIFLPAAGCRINSDLNFAGSRGDYWSSSLSTDYSDLACSLSFLSGNVGSYRNYRYNGRPVRPVLRDVEITISFDANGGTGTMSAMSYEKGETKVLTANKFTRTGYIFKGWNTKADGTGTSYTDKQSITPTENLTLYAQWEESKETGTANGYAWVDLGLPSGTKWATMNVGATSPEGYGDYFAWGETKSKSYYDWSTYKWCNGSFDTMTKYCTSSSDGTVDNKTTLDLSDDAAYVNWGSSWRMPTEAELDELSYNAYTTWTLTTQNGVEGYKVTSNINGNSIFLPAAGYRRRSDLINAGSRGYYWSSSLSTSGSYTAYSWYFYSYTDNGYDDYRNYGHSVRPVLRDVEFTFTIMFDGNGGEGTMPAIDGQHDDRVKIPASTFTREGYYFASWNTKADGTGTSYNAGEVITQAEDLTLYAQWEESKETGTANGYAWVDLGLPSGTKWATMNVGADSPEEYGDYFAWGETNTKSSYTSSTYSYSSNPTTLPLDKDAAYINWGPSWRMPTRTEQNELSNTSYTTWTWTTQNGVKGYKVTSKINGNSIFLPAVGYCLNSDLYDAGSGGLYWSSSLDMSRSNDAYLLYFGSDDVGSGCNYRLYGQSVRPVLRDVEFSFTIMFDGNGGEGTMPAIDGQHDDMVTIPLSSTFTREGYFVASWNTKADGTGTSYKVGEAITQAEDLTLYAQWEPLSGTSNGYTWVDLGLPSGTRWATINVGADSPEEYGDYFAWGETEPKDYYRSSNYNYSGNPTTLPLDKDAAYINWGPSWRMPTEAEQNELSNTSYTIWTWTTQNGVKGYKVTSKINGNSIFLPAAGYRYVSDNLVNAGSSGGFWSSSLTTYDSGYAYGLYFNSANVYISNNYRYYGQSVRPVLNEIFTLGFDGNGGSGRMSAVELDRNESTNIPANTFTRRGYEFIGWNTKADGTGTSYTEGQTISLTENKTLYAQWEKFNITGTANGHDYVDLGLPSGTKWATCNVGAEFPEDYGDYFAWGETESKSIYNWETYKWCKGDYDTQTKYCTSSSYGTVDNKTTLDLSDDAAYVNWGRLWRMPTIEEQDELRNTNYTTWTWTKQNGVKGYKVTSKTNGNSIFLPAAGYRPDSNFYDPDLDGKYWSSSLCMSYSSDKAYCLFFDSDGVKGYYGSRGIGWSVRPVLQEIFTLRFDGNGGGGRMSAVELDRNESTNIPANTLTRRGYKFIGWNTKADGTGTPYTEGQTISLTKNTTLYAQWEKFKITGTANGHDYVDLGLPSGTLWATCNVGAEFPEDYGDYFAWGETTTKSTYNWSNYKWCKGDYDTQTKYCTSSSYGTVDNNTILDLSDDAAYVNWGSSWRMPTYAELKELKDNCTWTPTTQNGVKGYKVTSIINGNSIFLPAAGYRDNSDLVCSGSFGNYWSSSLYTGSSRNAYYFYFTSDNVYNLMSNRYGGHSVRPVLRNVELTFTIMFDSNGGEGTMPAIDGQHDDRMKIPASTFTREGYFFASWNTKADGTGTSYKVGEVITQTEDLILYAQWEESKSGTANGYAWVDLGLPSGTKWATMNVGADSPEEYGDYFAWGETTPKSTYNWSTYKWCKGDDDTQTKYCTSSSYGTVDNKTILDLSDDAAYVNWGPSWRMPTRAEQDELRNTNYTTWTWTTQNGVNGYKVTSKTNGNSIFLPAAGYRGNSVLSNTGSYCYYWSSSLNTNNSNNADNLYFKLDFVYSNNRERSYGQPVRPVLAE